MTHRNPVMGLAGFEKLRALDPTSRAALESVLRDLAADAHARAEKSWRTRKAPMAAYWRSVGVYAGHIARALRSCA